MEESDIYFTIQFICNNIFKSINKLNLNLSIIPK
jgi:hypothetical protein